MPQLDMVTFAPIAYYTFLIYIGGYIIFNLTIFVQFFNKIKIMSRLWAYCYKKSVIVEQNNANLLNFSWII